jgi:hypothetical protein
MFGDVPLAVVRSEACAAVPTRPHAASAWIPRGEPSAFDLIGTYDDEVQNDRLRRLLSQTVDYQLLDRYPGPGELEDHLIAVGLLDQRRCRGREPLSSILAQHGRTVASSLDPELDGDALLARALTELATRAGITELVFDESGPSNEVQAFARGQQWTLYPSQVALHRKLCGFLNAVCRDCAIDTCFVELHRAHHITWGTRAGIGRAARDGVFGNRQPAPYLWADADSDDEGDGDEFAAYDVIPPIRFDSSVFSALGYRSGLAESVVRERIESSIRTELNRTFPLIRFDVSFEDDRFVPVALTDATDADVAELDDRGVVAQPGDELAFPLVPASLADFTRRWPALELKRVYEICDQSIGRAAAEIYAPEWLGQ